MLPFKESKIFGDVFDVVTRKTKGVEKLEEFSLQNSSDSTFFFNPCFHKEQFPRTIIAESPDRFLLTGLNRDNIINALEIILPVSSYKILIISPSVDFTSQKYPFDHHFVQQT